MRERLNARLQNNELGGAILEWLNSLPEVRKVLDAQFGGKPINPTNLSMWRRGGWRDWQAEQEAFNKIAEIASDADELKQLSSEPLTEKLAPWLVANYTVAVKAAMAGDGGPGDFKLLRKFCADVVALRRGDHKAACLKFQMERCDRLPPIGIKPI